MHVFMAKNSVRKTKQESDGVNTSLFRTRPRNICFAHTCIQQEGSTCFDAHESTPHMQMHCSLCRLRHSTLFTACLYKHFLPCFRILSLRLAVQLKAVLLQAMVLPAAVFNAIWGSTAICVWGAAFKLAHSVRTVLPADATCLSRRGAAIKLPRFSTTPCSWQAWCSLL